MATNTTPTSISTSTNQAVKRSISSVTVGLQKKTKLDNGDSKKQSSTNSTTSNVQSNSIRNQLPPTAILPLPLPVIESPSTTALGPPHPRAVEPPPQLVIVSPSTTTLVPPPQPAVVLPPPTALVLATQPAIVPTPQPAILPPPQIAIVPPKTFPILPVSTLPIAIPPTPTIVHPPIPTIAVLSSVPPTILNHISQQTGTALLPPPTTSKRLYTLSVALQLLSRRSSSTQAQNANSANVARLQALLRSHQSFRGNPPLIAGLSTQPYPYFLNFTAPQPSTSALALPPTPPIPTPSQSTSQTIPLSQPVSIFQHVTQRAYEILKPISPLQFTDAFIQSGSFKSDKMDPAEPQYYDILKYIFNSQAHQGFRLELLSVLKITRLLTTSPQSTVTSPQPPVPNPQVTSTTNRFTMMLWHGTKPRSVASILKEGFRCPHTGSQMFGKGVYFADRVSKSAQYCNQNVYCAIPKPEEIGYLFLCEVTLGKCYNAKNVKHAYKTAPTVTRRDGSVMTFDSLKCTGENIPDIQQQREIDGIISPLGPTVKNTRFPSYTVLYNEFIVYNPEMVLFI